MHRHQEVEPQDEVDLVDPDRVGAVQREHDDVDDAVGRLDLCALVAFEDILDDQWMEAQDGPDLLDLLRRRPGQVDPGAGLRMVEEAGQGLECLVAPELTERTIDHRRDADLTRPAGGRRRAAAGDRFAEADRGVRG